jgi:hypothetical protein
MRPTTQAAEGVPRLCWTLEEFERMGELGLLKEEDRSDVRPSKALVPVLVPAIALKLADLHVE